MKNKDLLFFRSWFRDYASSCCADDQYVNKNIRMKEKHTYDVCRSIVKIGKELGLDRNSLLLAETTALFHDLGRFGQFMAYKSFKDSSIDHAELSVRILKEKKVLEGLPEKEKALIYGAIRFHNIMNIPSNLQKDILFHLKLLRDADKLSIFPQLIIYYGKGTHDNPAMELELPDRKGYSRGLVRDLFCCSNIKIGRVKEFNDIKLYLLGWIYDINFKPTLVLIKKRGYADKIIRMLPQTEEIRRLRKHINDNIRMRLIAD